MPTLNWIGKEAVVNHHLQVPFQLLKDVPELACGEPGSGNLIVQGDNLVALKALLPYYAGQVKCIYIDPPYNTGNEGWVYNDNVNSPLIREWLGKTVGKEGETLDRHDRWLCMMYPRLALLKQLLSRDGIIAVSIDDNEVNLLGVLLDSMFGAQNRLACIPWLAEPSGGKQKSSLRKGHEYILVYHNGDDSNLTREEKSTGDLNQKDKFGKYRKGRELLKWGDQSLRADRQNMWFPLIAPDGTEVYPIRNDGREGRWRLGKENHLVRKILEDPEHVYWEVRPFDNGIEVDGKLERLVPYEKIRDVKRSFGWSTWLDSVGFNADATRELKDIFGNKNFDTPKPTQLINWIISIHQDDDALVLDSFAGSGTTAHAVLNLNKQDGGNRRFILVEIESSIAQDVTAERVRRVAEGYTNAKGEQAEGLGGGFRFCELGEPLFDEEGKIRETVVFADLARHVWFTETGEPLAVREEEQATPPQYPLIRGEVLKAPPLTRGGGGGVCLSPLLGDHRGTAIYLLYNGILGDKSATGGNVLTRAVLAQLPAFDGTKVIYCAGCLLGHDRLQAERIIIRQTPYEVRIS